MTTDDSRSGLPELVHAQALLGYLNFSEGRPDPRFQKQLNDSFAAVAGDSQSPWDTLRDRLLGKLNDLHAHGSAAFQDISQAAGVLPLALGEVLAAYRTHHADLLFHQNDAELFQPFFL